jgi:hypothetical protein
VTAVALGPIGQAETIDWLIRTTNPESPVAGLLFKKRRSRLQVSKREFFLSALKFISDVLRTIATQRVIRSCKDDVAQALVEGRYAQRLKFSSPLQKNFFGHCSMFCSL